MRRLVTMGCRSHIIIQRLLIKRFLYELENSTNTDCFVTQEFNVIVNTTPTANPVADISICDDNNDGVSSFDFNTDVTPDVLDAQGG